MSNQKIINFRWVNGTLSAFFARKINSKLVHTSYYLMGYRGQHLVFRSSALADTLHRVYVFLRAGVRLNLNTWLLGWGIADVGLGSWMARLADVGSFIQVGRQYSLVVWGGRFFAIRTFYFSITTVRFLGCDILLILTSPNRIGEYQLLDVLNFGIPTVGLGRVGRGDKLFDFFLPSTGTRGKLTVFYARVMLCFLAK